MNYPNDFCPWCQIALEKVVLFDGSWAVRCINKKCNPRTHMTPYIVYYGLDNVPDKLNFTIGAFKIEADIKSNQARIYEIIGFISKKIIDFKFNSNDFDFSLPDKVKQKIQLLIAFL